MAAGRARCTTGCSSARSTRCPGRSSAVSVGICSRSAQNSGAMQFSKVHAYGNDFLYVRESDATGRQLDVLARMLCDRHTGAGADGLIVFDAPPGGTPSMRLFNADGGIAEVSGNGLRGLAALLLRDSADPAA